MISVIETVLDRFEDLIYEIMIQRKKAEHDIRSLADPVVIHLIKALKWHDPMNFKKHLRDINGWLRRIQRIKVKTGRRPKPSDYYEWMFAEPIPSSAEITRIVNGELNDYHSLQVLRTNEEVYETIRDMMKRLSHDLSQDQFEGIADYL